ncbi:MAG: PilN domain-containing protein [Pirellulaceae bacterium]
MKFKQSASDLLRAAEKQSVPLERRRSPKQKVKRDRRRGVTRRVGLEISPSGIACAIVELSEDGNTRRLIVERIAFPPQSGPPNGDWSDGTLRELLCDLAVKYQLAGQPVAVGMGGDPCVTRVVAGANDDVESEVAELTGRTHRYIGMGRGEKVCCETTTRIDAKRKRSWVTVAMRNVVDEIASAIQAAGMRLAHMEHTMLVLCQILSAYEKDSTEPVLLIVDELGRMDLGISYRGQLLLDYRPAMPDKSVSEGSIVQRHIKCLRRYIWSQMPDLQADLSTVFVTGVEMNRSSLDKSIDDHSSLHRSSFPLKELCEGFEVVGQVSEDPGQLAAIGLARQANPEHGVVDSRNNLMSTLRASNRIAWLPLLKNAWPIAAAILFAIVLTALGKQERNIASHTKQEIESLFVLKSEVQRARFVLDGHLQRDRQIETIWSQVDDPKWAQLIWQTGNVLPQGMWLNSVRIQRDGMTHIVGGSFTDEAIYAYTQELKATGMFARVALASTSSTRVANGPATSFEIIAQFNKPGQQENNSFANASNRSISRG